MKKSNVLILLLLLFVGITSCNDDISSIEEDNLKYSLISPNNVRIAKSENDLNLKITKGKGKILDVSYIETDKNSVVAIIDYNINNQDFKIVLASGIENFRFPTDAILKFGQFTDDISKTNENDDVFISCMGNSCCAPGGTYDPATKQFNFHCRCEDGSNSGCIMRVSSKVPELKDQ
ncbi:hypothetical protein U8527_10435 [Kordia algicida OT-1]|uniref:Uncharacterized protein n=1 Tax=Kordia algicida OT-1 TaxID=391587 RepID=A9DW82_9FLAO|nr:hypothetical protein [Kordia algicida]EDP96523.1 hypothetical protein KAOT1_03902 [Kordia algicida OT-1]